MTTKKFGEIKAVAFDIDGTLYKSFNLYARMVPHFLGHSLFFLKYGLVRKDLRKLPPVDDFLELQGECMAKRLHCSAYEAKQQLDEIVYGGLKHYFYNIRACKGACETIKRFKNAGLKIALMSDFPPEQKGALWGIKPYCDVLLGSEDCGALKPSSVPFFKMAELLDVKPEEILYVGNSYKYDVVGARNAGMKSAWFVSSWNKLFHAGKKADIIFSKYKTLQDSVLKQ